MSQSTSTTNSTISLHGNNKNIQITCPGNNQVILICVNAKCKSDQTFICGSDQCKCQSNHELCIKANLSSVVKNIQTKIHNTAQIKTFIQEIVAKIIEEIKKFEDKLLSDIQKDIKYTKLVEVERILLNIVYQTQKNQKPFRPIDSALLWKIINYKEEEQSKLFDKTQDLLKNFQQESKLSIQKVNNSLIQVISDQSKKSQHILTKMAKQIDVKSSLSNSQKTIIDQLTKNSALCKTAQLSERLIRFFPKPLKSMKLLFKASEHGFKLAKFYDVCGLKTHTVILCQSNKGKIVGGYTPFSYYRQNLTGDMSVPDPNRESFMFSLTNNDKFVLNNIGQAVYISKPKTCIYFGNAQIVIYDNSNTATNNYLRCNNYYINQLYTCNTKDSYLSFNGNQTVTCPISQYQVWEVQFDQ